jgi:hypothetical protein
MVKNKISFDLPVLFTQITTGLYSVFITFKVLFALLLSHASNPLEKLTLAVSPRDFNARNAKKRATF